MALMKWRRGRRHKSDEKRRHREQSARLAPPEEKAAHQLPGEQGGANGSDTIRVDSRSVRAPQQLLAGERDAETFRPHPVVVVIVVIFLAFIAFIAWQITLMPPPAK